mgnify:CR=1 FL=1
MNDKLSKILIGGISAIFVLIMLSPSFAQVQDVETNNTAHLFEPLNISVLMNNTVPHAIKNDTDTPRVSVSFRFLVDPWEWAVNGI